MYTKQEYRKYAKKIRASLDMELLSKKLVEQIKEFDVYKQSKNVMLYYPLKGEVDLSCLLEDKTKNYYLPRTVGNDMQACPYKYGETLIQGDFNVMEPVTNAVDPKILDLIIVPALLIDENNYRLGYGKGYYDRFLQTTTAKSLVVIPKQCVVKNLPLEPHDKMVDFSLVA